MKSLQLFPVTVIVPMKNSETTVIKTLTSVLYQKYPIREIIVIDNVSTDKSIALVKSLQKKIKRIPLKLICQKENLGVGTSYNLGVNLAKTKHVIFMHSDSVLPTPFEFFRLTELFRSDLSVIATCAVMILPKKIWESYPFWEKCLLQQIVGKEIIGLNGKCDCLDKKAFLSVGGFDEKRYSRGEEIGGEDGDIAIRLNRIGKVIGSSAKVVHLHSLNPNYSIWDWIKNRRLFAKSYGRLFRYNWRSMHISSIVLLVKPLLSMIILLFPTMEALLLVIVVSNIPYLKMYTTASTVKRQEIILLPFVLFYMVFYETYWMINGYLYLTMKKV